MHDSSANLQAVGAKEEELGGVLPSGNAAHAGNRQFRVAHNGVSSERSEHVQCDGFYGRSGIAAVATLATDVRGDFERVQINADNGVDGVDERKGVGAGRDCSSG